MYSKNSTNNSIEVYSDKIEKIKSLMEEADAIVVGIGAGMSTSAGFTYSGERFERYFSDFGKKYGITDMYSGGFYPFETLEEQWAWWSRHILYNRYDVKVGKPYADLLRLLAGKNYFVITTNVDHQLQMAGIDKNRLFYTQGDFGLWQCSVPCHQQNHDNEEAVRQMVAQQSEMKIPTELVPYCPRCCEPMMMNLRIDGRFVEDEGWHAAKARYVDFVNNHMDKKVLFLELGIGRNTPVVIQYPFMQMTYRNQKAHYVPVNMEEHKVPDEIADRTIFVIGDIGEVLADLLERE